MISDQKSLQLLSNRANSRVPKETNDKLRKILKSNIHGGKIFTLNLYLQGSYKNHTNITSSDIDLIPEITFIAENKINQKTDYKKKIYSDIKTDICNAISQEYGTNNVNIGNKSIKINLENFNADVVPCFKFCKVDSLTHDIKDGMQFWTTEDNRLITHFPKIHHKNGVFKNKLTHGLYKPSVRLFKNIRKDMIKNSYIEEDIISSYFLESLIFNVPYNLFSIDYKTSVEDITKYLYASDIRYFRHPHLQDTLIGPTPEHLNGFKANMFIKNLREYVFESKLS